MFYSSTFKFMHKSELTALFLTELENTKIIIYENTFKL